MANLGYLQLTRDCLQSCRFCSNPPTGVELTLQEMEDELGRLASMGYDGVILTGGDARVICPDVNESELAQAIVDDLVLRGVAIAYYKFMLK